MTSRAEYIVSLRANGDGRTPALIGQEYDRIFLQNAPVLDDGDVIMEHIAPQQGIYRREYANGDIDVGSVVDGDIVWVRDV